MRWNYGVTAATLTLLALACGTNGPPQFPSVVPGPPLTVEGRTTIRTQDPHTIEVAVDDAEHADGRADHLFHLWTDDTLPVIDESFARAHLEFSGKELRIVANEKDLIVTLAVADVPPRPETAARSLRYTGYGLNHETGKNVPMHAAR